MKIEFDGKWEELAHSYRVEHYELMEGAMTRAARQSQRQILLQGRRVIRAAGFSQNWTQNLRATVYPERGESLRPTIWVYHRIPYAHVFEEGATIRGKPMLFIPTRSATRGRKRLQMTPKKYRQFIGPLRRIDKGGKVYLVGTYPGEKQGAVMFIGIPRVRVPQKWFSIDRVVEQASLRLPNLYFQNLVGR